MQYLIPGFIYVNLTLWGTHKHIKNTYNLILSAVFSFVFMTFSNIFLAHYGITNMWTQIGLSITVGILLFIVTIVLFNTKFIHDFFVDTLGISFYSTVWERVIDSKNGTNVKIHLKDKNFYVIGHFRKLETNNDPSILLADHIICDNATDEFIADYSNADTYFIVKMSEIDYTEIF